MVGLRSLTVGVLLWRRRGQTRIGRLMAATGVTWLAGSLVLGSDTRGGVGRPWCVELANPMGWFAGPSR